jgi:acetylornithine deacetylase
MDTPIEHPLVQSLISSSVALGAHANVRGLEAVCDAAHYAGAGVAGVIFGPGGDGFHGDNEYLDLESMRVTAKVIASAVIQWCGVK